MARGVQETEVFEAADALLGAGERPTVERVRLRLGRGSPNTIGPLLDAWWAQLAARVQHRLTLPAVPEDVGVALAQVWELALQAGRALAEADVAPERAALAQVLATVDARLAAEREAVAQAEAAQQQATTEAQATTAALAISEQRAGDLSGQVSQLKRHLEHGHARARGAAGASAPERRSRLRRDRSAAAGTQGDQDPAQYAGARACQRVARHRAGPARRRESPVRGRAQQCRGPGPPARARCRGAIESAPFEEDGCQEGRHERPPSRAHDLTPGAGSPLASQVS